MGRVSPLEWDVCNCYPDIGKLVCHDWCNNHDEHETYLNSFNAPLDEGWEQSGTVVRFLEMEFGFDSAPYGDPVRRVSP